MKNTFKTTLAIVALAFAAGCASHSKDAESHQAAPLTKTDKAALSVGGSQYVVIDFNKNSSALSAAGKQALSELSSVAQADGRRIDEIKVLAWADREYPADGAKATRRDIKLADDRADNVKSYLKNELTMSDIDNHNMAKRPGTFGELMKTDDYKLKNAFEKTGAAPVDNRITGSKAAKAVVLVKYR